MLRFAVTMSALAYDVAWKAAGWEEHHLGLKVPSPGETWEERRQLERQAWAELNNLGVAQAERLSDELAAALHLIARAGHEFFGWYTTTPEQTLPSSVVVGVGRNDAVSAHRVGDTVTLSPARATGAIDALLSALPNTPAAVAPSVNFALDALQEDFARRSRSDSGGYLSTVHSSGRDAGPIRQARELLTKPRQGGGELHAASRNRMGQRKESTRRFTYVDTADGRLALLEQSPRNGQIWATVTPGNRNMMAQTLSRMLSEIPHA